MILVNILIFYRRIMKNKNDTKLLDLHMTIYFRIVRNLAQMTGKYS